MGFSGLFNLTQSQQPDLEGILTYKIPVYTYKFKEMICHVFFLNAMSDNRGSLRDKV